MNQIARGTWRNSLIFALAGAVVGGIASGAIVLGFSGRTGKNIQAETIAAKTIHFDELVSREGEKITCRIKNGVIEAEKQIRSGEIKGLIICGSNILAAVNPVSDLQNTKVFAELAATKNGGAVFSLRNQHGGVFPGKLEKAEGNIMVFGYDQSGDPIIYVQNVALGDKGIRYLYRSAAPAQDTADNAPKPDASGKPASAGEAGQKPAASPPNPASTTKTK